jgi:hypothetical protein
MSVRLEGKVSVTTDTDGSMGRGAALAFAREGAPTVVSDVSIDATQATLGPVRGSGGAMDLDDAGMKVGRVLP